MPAAAAAATPGSRRRAISTPRCCSPSRRRRPWRRNCRSSPRWRCTMRSANARRSSGPSLKVKWPNDLLLGPAKLAGILIEGESEPAFAVAIGIGVNCASHPEGTAFPATDLAAAGALVAPEALFAALERAMAPAAGAMERGRWLCRDPRRLAQARRGLGRADPGAACRSANSPAASTASMRRAACSSSSRAA